MPREPAVLRVAVFGLGEAGSEIAADLAAAGAEVSAFDPAPVLTPPGVRREAEPVAAVVGADVVLAITAAGDAERALTQALTAVEPGAVFADLATGSAGLKQHLGRLAAASGVAFADVALMSTVPGQGLRTPALVSGPGAPALVERLAPLGMPIELAGAEPGEAATRKLLRSVVMKGLAALIIESMQAANAAGMAEATWANLAEQFRTADEAFIRRLVVGTAPHARRRLHEMETTAELLTELGVDPLMTRATVESLRRLTTGAPLPDLP